MAALAALLSSSALAQHPRSKPRIARALPAQAASLPPAPLVGGSDSCATPDAIAGTGLFAFDDTAATTGPDGQGEAACNLFGNTAIKSDVWFVWTAPASGIATVTTVQQTIVDTKIAAYPAPVPGGGCPASGSALACNDDDVGSGTFQSTIAFRCASGSQYMLQVGLFPGPFPPALPGTGNLSILVTPVLVNDECSSASVVAGFGPGAPHAYDTSAATTGTAGQNNAACESFATRAIDGDLWFEWTSTVTGWVRLSTCAGASNDTKVAVYQGAGCPGGAPLVCDDDACGTVGGAAEARFFANSGTPYTLQLGTFPGQAGGPGSFTIEAFTPAAGDDCHAPLLIAGDGPHPFDDRQATTGVEGQAELLCTTLADPNPRIAYDLWYQWTAPGTGTATWTTCGGSSLDSKLAVYAAGSCPTSASLACNDESCVSFGPSTVSFPVSAGQPYMLQLGAWPGAVASSGTFTVTLGSQTGVPFCFGDGTGTSCPCSPGTVAPGSASNGCPNSFYAGGANLRATGRASVASDSLALQGSGMPNGGCLYFQGTVSLVGSAFGDGLLCSGGTTTRLGIKQNTNGWSTFPLPGDAPISQAAGVPPAGGMRVYQVWYRNSEVFCTSAGHNMSNGTAVTWTP